MRQRFFPKLLIISLCLILYTTVFAQGQSTYIPITAQTAAQITQLQRIGKGDPRVLLFSPDASHLAVATALGLWMIPLPIQDDANPQMQLLEGQEGALSVAFAPNGSWVAVGGEDNSVMVFDAATGATIARLENHLYGVFALAWSADGKWLASSDIGGMVHVWDSSDWSDAHALMTTFGPEILEFNPAATQLTVTTSHDQSVWNIADGKLISKASPGTGKILFESVESIDAGNLHASYYDEKAQIQLSETKTARLINTLEGFYGQLTDVFFTSDGGVGASRIHPVFVWSLADGQLDMKRSPVISPDGLLRADFENDEVIGLRHNKTGSVIAALHGPIRAVTDMEFSPDSKLLVSSSADGTIQVWDATVTQDSGPIVTLKGHNGGVTSVAFNADGTLIASTGYDGTMRLWGIKA